jgi:hypothetical protein
MPFKREASQAVLSTRSHSFQPISPSPKRTYSAKSKTYGDDDPEFTYTITSGSLDPGDELTGSLSRSTGENVGTYAIQKGSLSGGSKYQITFVPANLTITKKNIQVTAQAKTKIYGSADPALTYTSTPSLVGSDSFSGALTRAAGENVGTYAIQLGSLSAGNNYTISYTGASLTVTKQTIQVTAQAKTKQYGDADPDLTYTSSPSLLPGNSFSGSLSRTAGENVGSYAIQQGTLSAGNNYTLSYTTANLTITKRTITVTADSKTKTFGETDPPLTFTHTPSLIASDSFSGELVRDAGEALGTYPIRQGTLSLSNNYNLIYQQADFTIVQNVIHVTAVAKTKIYGDTDPEFTFTFTPALSGTDTFTGSLTRVPGENAGSYAIQQGSLSLGENYGIVFTPANLTISKKNIQVTAQAKTKIYGSADPALTYTSTPSLVGSDSFSGALTRAAGENVGTYAIQMGSLSAGNNYTISYTGASLTVTKQTIQVTAQAKTKQYGDADPDLTYTSSPSLLPGNSFSGSLSRTAGENVGSYAIQQGTLSAGNNYTLSYTTANLTITKRTITVTADSKTKTFGETDPPLTFTHTPSLIASDSFSGELVRDAGEALGTYPIRQGTLSLSNNYNLIYQQADFTIVQNVIHVTAVAKTKIYGDTDPEFTFTFTPALSGTDTFTGSLTRVPGENAGSYAIQQGSLSLGENYGIVFTPANLTISKKNIQVTAQAKTKIYGSADPALTYTSTPSLVGSDSFSGALTRAAGENVGTYAIQMGSLSAGNNYTISYTGASLTVTKQTIHVTAQAKTKQYGDADPDLTYSSSPSLLPGNSFSGTLTRAAGENTGTYAIQQGTLSAGNNYTLSYTGANLTITKRTITVTAQGKSKVYGDNDPLLTYTVNPSLSGSDSFSGTLTRSPGENVGSYPIGIGSLSAGNNYQISFVAANLSISHRSITVTAEPQTKVYGNPDPEFSYSVFPPLVGTDTFTGKPGRSSGEQTGNYPIQLGTLSAGTNYIISFNPSILTIIKKNIKVVAQNQTKLFGDPDPELTYFCMPGLVGQDEFFGSLTRTEGESTGTYVIRQGSLTAGDNYKITFVMGSLTIQTTRRVILSAEPGVGQVMLSWTEPADQSGAFNGYRIYRDGNMIFATQSKSFTDETVTNYVQYEYMVTAVFNGVESDPSNLVTAIPNSGFSGGNGSAADPYLVATAEQLNNVRYHLRSHFKQTEDIDLSITPWNLGEGWHPIGNQQEESFRGLYDGNGRVISGLTINRTEESGIGLFGYIENAVIRNMSLKQVNISASAQAGAITGILGEKAIIETSYSTGTIKADSIAGGIAGMISHSAVIRNSYSHAMSEGQKMVGGLAGLNNYGVIENSFSTGRVTGSNEAGGLVGSGEGGTVSNSYWNRISSGQEVSNGGASRTTGEMIYPEDAEAFPEWNFESIWDIDINKNMNQGYPYLLMQASRIIHMINVSMNPARAGVIHGDGPVQYGSMARLNAIPKFNRVFLHWLENEEILTDEHGDPIGSAYEFRVRNDRDLVAVFAVARGTVQFNALDEEGNIVQNVSIHVEGSTDNITLSTGMNGTAQVSLPPGTYTYQVRDAGFEEATGSFRLEETQLEVLISLKKDPGSISQSGSFLKVFPNPSWGRIHIEYTVEQPEMVIIEIMDLNGRMIQRLEKHVETSLLERFDLSHLPKGFYLVRVIEGQKSLVSKIILN